MLVTSYEQTKANFKLNMVKRKNGLKWRKTEENERVCADNSQRREARSKKLGWNLIWRIKNYCALGMPRKESDWCCGKEKGRNVLQPLQLMRKMSLLLPFRNWGANFVAFFFHCCGRKLRDTIVFFFFKFYGTKINTILCQINGMGVAIAVRT